MSIVDLGPTALCGPPDGALNGIECRTLRASLGLERRSVAAWINMRFHTPRPVTAAEIASWEKSKGRGYPQDLVADLAGLERGVQQMAERLFADATDKGSHLVLRRPLGARRILSLLDLGNAGVELSDAQLAALDTQEGAREIWQALADAATVRAALEAAAQYDQPPRIEMDRESDAPAGEAPQPYRPISPAPDPMSQSALPPELLDLVRKAAAINTDAAGVERAVAAVRAMAADGDVTTGDLRRLYEAAPGLVQLAANNLRGRRQGVRTPRLQGMVIEGLVTAEAFIAAILRAAPDIERDYADWRARNPKG